MKQPPVFVLVRYATTGAITVHGDRYGQPFKTRVNAQRSCTRRDNDDRLNTWQIIEVQP
jgi:hypothetical protein